MKRQRVLFSIGLFLLIFLSQITLVQKGFADPAYVREDSDNIYAGNDHIEIILQKSDGRLYGIKQKLTNTDFIRDKNAWWGLFNFVYYTNDQPVYVGGGSSLAFSYGSRSLDDGVALDLHWNGFQVNGNPLNMKADVTIEVKNSSPLSYWSIVITNNESITIEAIYFPTINGLGQISDNPEQDYLVYPSMSGMVFQNPLANFVEERGWGYKLYYPSAYSTMQFMAYYGLQPEAGLYVASYDQGGSSKYFDFNKPVPAWAVAQIAHIPEFVSGADYHMGYPIVVGVFSGDWYNAAQLYRTWAIGQPWTHGARWLPDLIFPAGSARRDCVCGFTLIQIVCLMQIHSALSRMLLAILLAT